MNLIRYVYDEENPMTVYLVVEGFAGDGQFKTASITTTLSEETPEEWFTDVTNEVEIQAEIDAGQVNTEREDRHYVRELGADIATELSWLDSTIPQIDGMALADLRSTLKRLAKENQGMLKAWQLLVRKYQS